MSRNELQTRSELIDPALETRGWFRSDIRVETTAARIDIIDGKSVRRLTGRTGYVLRSPLTEGGEPIPQIPNEWQVDTSARAALA